MSAPPVYSVYVIELTPVVGRRPTAKPDVYVGSTALSPEARFRKHKTQPKASRHVRDRGVRLRPDLLPHDRSFPTRAAAKAAEKKLAHDLHARGHRVYGACSPRTSSSCVM
jgi:hypothetical protein